MSTARRTPPLRSSSSSTASRAAPSPPSSDDRNDQRELQLRAVRRDPRSHERWRRSRAGPPRTSEGLNNKYEDDVSGLAYYGARYYDKTLIGWTQGDPLYRFAPDAAWKTPTRSNLYRFSGNNPLRYVDPDGLDLNQALAEVNKKCQCSDTDFNKSSTFEDVLDAVTQFIVPGYAELRFATAIIEAFSITIRRQASTSPHPRPFRRSIAMVRRWIRSTLDLLFAKSLQPRFRPRRRGRRT